MASLSSDSRLSGGQLVAANDKTNGLLLQSGRLAIFAPKGSVMPQHTIWLLVLLILVTAGNLCRSASADGTGANPAGVAPVVVYAAPSQTLPAACTKPAPMRNHYGV